VIDDFDSHFSGLGLRKRTALRAVDARPSVEWDELSAVGSIASLQTAKVAKKTRSGTHGNSALFNAVPLETEIIMALDKHPFTGWMA
jgi:hypothetical protein